MREIGNFLREQIGVRDDEQLAVDRAQTRALQSDALDGGGARVIFDRLADAERPVEDDRERGEEIRKNALRGKADRDTAATETRHQPGDLDPHIVENDDARDREQRDADQQADAAPRVAARSEEHTSEL